MKKRNGLTLIEVVVSIAIIGIISISVLNIFNTGLKNILIAGKRTDDTLNAKSIIDGIIYDQDYYFNEDGSVKTGYSDIITKDFGNVTVETFSSDPIGVNLYIVEDSNDGVYLGNIKTILIDK